MSRRGQRAQTWRAAPVASTSAQKSAAASTKRTASSVPTVAPSLVGELAEDPHGAEGDRGGEADEGTDERMASILPDAKRQERFGLLTYIR